MQCTEADLVVWQEFRSVFSANRIIVESLQIGTSARENFEQALGVSGGNGAVELHVLRIKLLQMREVESLQDEVDAVTNVERAQRFRLKCVRVARAR